MKKFIATSLTILLMSGCSNGLPEAVQSAKPVSTVTVRKSNLTNTLIFSGNLQAANEVDLSAKAAGRIGELFADVGDNVKKGKTLAKLDATTEKATVYSLEQSLGQAQKSYDALDQLYNERIKSAVQMLEITKKSGSQNIAILQKQLDEAKNSTLTSTNDLGKASIETIQSQIDAAKKDLQTRADTTLTNASLLAKQVEEVVGPIVGDTYHGGNVVQPEFGLQDQTLKFDTSHQFGEFLKQKQQYLNSTESSQDKKILMAIDLLTEAASLLANTQSVLNKSVSSTYLSNADLQVYQSAVVSLATQNSTLLQNLRDLYGSDGIAGQIAVLSNQLTQTEAQAAASKSSINTQIALLEKQLAKAHIDVDGQNTQAELGLSILQKEKTSQLANAGSALTQLVGQAGITSTMVGNSIVQAPFSGIITSRLAEIGAVVSPGMPLFHLADDSRLKLMVEVADSLAPSFQVIKTAQVSVDGYDKGALTAKISKIHPAANPLSKKITIELVMDNPAHSIKPGSFATASFSLDANDQLVVPSGAVMSRYGSSFIFVVKDQKANQTKVEIGNSNEFETSILAGVNEGDEVIVKGNSYLQDGDLILATPLESADARTITAKSVSGIVPAPADGKVETQQVTTK